MYEKSIEKVAKTITIKNASILVTGATGLIGSCVIDVLNCANEKFDAGIKIYALSRSKEKILKRFGTDVVPIVQNIMTPLDNKKIYNYIIHGASNADPKLYATQPVETMLTNIIGNKNVLEYCSKHLETKMILTSTFEVYGKIENQDIYSENISGIIDQTILRNVYPESKRCCEFLVRSYVEEYNVNAVIARLPSVYGPTMQNTDSKAHAQFIRNALKGEDIVLKSNGMQKRTYCYVIDAASAIFKILSDGENGEIYNISNEKSVASIAEVANVCANMVGAKVVYNLPDEIETRGFSKPLDCILDNRKLKNLGWKASYSLYDGLCETLEYLRVHGELCR